ncbi:MAG: Putative Holliday junction resolvase [Anaerolinea thermophila]|uniref:Putative pre-16S rRNA nuclease n=1 Tax=Anaerolinea thermophila TaxID=167964 RepID=A0A101FZ46_9CHLR|nr:MAG: Putative Holliday junction resolvase [Anaerolinea thermophila]
MVKNNSMKRYLGIDPGEKHIGVAISDPSGTISRPFCIIQHTSYQESAEKIAGLCREQEIGEIIIGVSQDEDGEATFSGRKALRLGEALKNSISIPVQYWDETGTTRAAQQSRREMGVRRKHRQGHLDDVAACILLQSYLDFLCEHGV